MDLVFSGRPNITVLAVADADSQGRSTAQQRSGAQRSYAYYRELLANERPQLVSIAPRWTDQRLAMITAALDAGAHIYCEKPFASTLAQADSLLAQAARSQRRIAVAHQGRLAPNTLLLKQQLEDGLIGERLEIRIYGKQDRRAGGEDMVVLGTHQFDLARFFARDAIWCTARVLHAGRDITPANARRATEDIGPIAGDEITAMFAFTNGVNVHYTSRARYAHTAGPWGMELIGSNGRARLLNDPFTDVLVWRGGELSTRGQTGAWEPISGAAPGSAESRAFSATNRRVVDDWLDAITDAREPVCSAQAAMKSLEMIHAVFAAGLTRCRVALPLARREHPLGDNWFN